MPVSPSSPGAIPDSADARSRGIRRTTLIAVATNAFLAVAQVAIGLLANAFSLVADAAHTFSDLVTDLLVLVAGKRGADPADKNHPYGHGRIETATSLVLGVALAGVGIGFLLSSGLRLQHMDDQPDLHPVALAMALLTLLAKEALFRYTLAASRRLKAPLLEANAWHARSDAASSLVVAAGIGGSLAGYPFLEPLGAAVVGFLILSMGLRLAWKAMRELVDTGLPEEEVARLRRTIQETPGVVGLHELRTRRMADRILCDAHVQVDPRLTVSEGHRISDRVYFRLRAAHPEIQDALVHIDAELDDQRDRPHPALPERAEILAQVHALLGTVDAPPERVQIHYLGDSAEVEILLPPGGACAEGHALKQRTEAWTTRQPAIRKVSYFQRIAP
ncbi:cation diffusion facilitator family transporter [Azoarcus indigens]|uniref:Cation diffusion facilitator family transporter n=1 Tax=Azoarcus indigens TaxID=29545 RepID=A0A4R6E7Y8_9RHOO|nr:cation diffusion facilitator family transporter [Azoarcus indigens]NMG64060.1 cation diffusion facilitator family transporter [Azoarcus indigens]TDN53664.1 cation diffusion facilitator family transporter [Azoarcus indigens]